MSKATIIMIAHATGDDGIDRLNSSLLNKVGINGILTRVDTNDPGWDPSTAVHIGSFNHLDEPEFIRLVREAAWQHQDKLQLFIDREDDSTFTEYDLFDQIVPKTLIEQAIGRGLGLFMPSQQLFFSEHFKSKAGEALEADIDTVWMFEVMAIHPTYYFEANARIIPYGNSTALDTRGFTVSRVDLVFDGVPVRWGSNNLDILDYADKSVKVPIRDLNPGDQVAIAGRIRVEPTGICTLYEVRSISKHPSVE